MKHLNPLYICPFHFNDQLKKFFFFAKRDFPLWGQFY